MTQYKRNPYGGAKRKFDGKWYDRVYASKSPTKANAEKAKKHYKNRGYLTRIVTIRPEGKTRYLTYVRKK